MEQERGEEENETSSLSTRPPRYLTSPLQTVVEADLTYSFSQLLASPPPSLQPRTCSNSSFGMITGTQSTPAATATAPCWIGVLPRELLRSVFEQLIDHEDETEYAGRDLCAVCLVGRVWKEEPMSLLWWKVVIKTEEKASLCLMSPVWGQYRTECLVLCGQSGGKRRRWKKRLELLERFEGLRHLKLKSFGLGISLCCQLFCQPNMKDLINLKLDDVYLSDNPSLNSLCQPLSLPSLSHINSNVVSPSFWYFVTSTTLMRLHLHFPQAVDNPSLIDFFRIVAPQLKSLTQQPPNFVFDETFSSCVNLEELELRSGSPGQHLAVLVRLRASPLRSLTICIMTEFVAEILQMIRDDLEQLAMFKQLKRYAMNIDWEKKVDDGREDLLGALRKRNVEVPKLIRGE